MDTRPEGSAAQFTHESILRDYRIACRSREASLLGRREVFSGKAKFGIFGDGKEVAQLALARACRPGDIRSGYYRDQTLLMALGLLSVEELFAQLYADPDPEREPCSAGRQMTAHFATHFLDGQGSWKNLLAEVQSSADASPTGSQMPRLVGLAYASRLYRQLGGLSDLSGFSENGNEIAVGTIGNATCAEGIFWESINAAGVLRAPMLLSIWDDGYGISVPNEYQVTKGDMTELLRGFRRAPGEDAGFDIYTAKGWDYPGLCETYLNAAEIVRLEHVPAIVHVREMTQPQGHSTSGSHERYKSAERLAWEEEFDCIRQMRLWMIAQGFANERELADVEEEEKSSVREGQRSAWEKFRASVDIDRQVFDSRVSQLASTSRHTDEIRAVERRLDRLPHALRRELMSAATELLILTRDESLPERDELAQWQRQQLDVNHERYGSHLHSGTAASALAVAVVPAEYESGSEATPESLRGFEILNACFDRALERYPNLVAFGEDVGRLGDVNQGMSGLQEKYGELRVSDTGIREATILGQAIGLAMRGIRPIAEIQYLDYLLYALQIMSDDLATLRWRTRGGQCAPVIVRTRGHRLEGVWHSGSEMGGILNLIRGMYLCVPRNMTQAAGMYNTLLQSDDPAVVVEVLNAYRAKEPMPTNIGEFTVPLGVPQVLREGSDVTLVTYGACCKIALAAADLLATTGTEVEVVDAQTLLPFDGESRILESIKKTSRVVFVDEDVPGGATAYMMQKVLVEQEAFQWLDAEPLTISAKAHRPPYGSDGDYFTKPNREQIFHAVYDLMHRSDPARYPEIR
ncbi:MAG: transketolase [bacterium]|nr:transketolase [bacterium]